MPSAEELLDALEQLRRPQLSVGGHVGNPYRGLQSFDRKHRSLFFGRSSDIRAAVERLRSDPMVVITGDSGVGKSSLSAAGVVPAICEGALEDGRTWTALHMKPGRRPIGVLTAQLALLAEESEDRIAYELRETPFALTRFIRTFAKKNRGLIFYVDQLEELITLAAEDEAQLFTQLLTELSGSIVGARLLTTVRSDFLMRLAALPGFGEEVSRALYILRPLSQRGIRAAIVEPARATSTRFASDAMIDSLVESTARTQGGLPLLQFTLAELWEAREPVGATVPADGIHSYVISEVALDRIGGLEGALARHADEVLSRMLPEERRAARKILIRLVTLEGTRAVRSREELAQSPAAESALDALVRGRLVVARGSTTEPVSGVHSHDTSVSYEVAHEALLSGWDNLRRWLAEEFDRRATHERLERAAENWERLAKSRDALWGKKQLAEAHLLDTDDLKANERVFLEASHDGSRRARNRLRAMIVGFPLLLLTLYLGFRAHAEHDVTKRANQRLAEAHVSFDHAHDLERQLQIVRSRAFALFDHKKVAEGERLWSDVLGRAAMVEREQSNASKSLEAALVLDASRQDVRHAIAQSIADRAHFAELEGAPVSIHDVADRMALYDPQLAHDLSAPAHLSVETTPSAEVALIRYDRTDPSGAFRPVRYAGDGTIHDLPLEPDSYLVEARTPGRATVRESMLLRRGETKLVHLDLPKAEVVPNDFVYIPAGTFLFGSAGDESVRREFYRTVPLHEVHTDAYLIARHETTFKQWIEFLNSLPATERAHREPKVASHGFHGSVSLEPIGKSDWELRFQVTTHEYRARLNEKITYQSRPKRVVQDWLAMPVSGISYEDVVAYTAWLDRTGKVPHARACREDEWERAARGADGRAFPHGDDLEPDDANWDATYDKQPLAFGPDEVGSHTGSLSPFGIHDMAGNVWEWTNSVLNEGERIARGGSFYFAAPSQRSANREPCEPTLRHASIGVRVCADPAR